MIFAIFAPLRANEEFDSLRRLFVRPQALFFILISILLVLYVFLIVFVRYSFFLFDDSLLRGLFLLNTGTYFLFTCVLVFF